MLYHSFLAAERGVVASQPDGGTGRHEGGRAAGEAEAEAEAGGARDDALSSSASSLQVGGA